MANPIFTNKANAQGAVGIGFSFTVLANPLTNDVYTADNLPAGLSINSATGVISGTPSITGTYPVPIQGKGDEGSVQGMLAINISP